uniref:Uncharacterized protein n=1 Tax=Timema bartmani TaxID=61472 RepID=A0A7R9FAP3_9NEOP|nr:unnamed protein product [Timema bartmani]
MMTTWKLLRRDVVEDDDNVEAPKKRRREDDDNVEAPKKRHREDDDNVEAPKKRCREDDSLNPRNKYVHLYNEIIDTMVGQMELRSPRKRQQALMTTRWTLLKSREKKQSLDILVCSAVSQTEVPAPDVSSVKHSEERRGGESRKADNWEPRKQNTSSLRDVKVIFYPHNCTIVVQSDQVFHAGAQEVVSAEKGPEVPGSIPDASKCFCEAMGLERSQLSLARTNEDLMEWSRKLRLRAGGFVILFGIIWRRGLLLDYRLTGDYKWRQGSHYTRTRRSRVLPAQTSYFLTNYSCKLQNVTDSVRRRGRCSALGCRCESFGFDSSIRSTNLSHSDKLQGRIQTLGPLHLDHTEKEGGNVCKLSSGKQSSNSVFEKVCSLKGGWRGAGLLGAGGEGSAQSGQFRNILSLTSHV